MARLGGVFSVLCFARWRVGDVHGALGAFFRFRSRAAAPRFGRARVCEIFPQRARRRFSRCSFSSRLPFRLPLRQSI
jgi:hypothetical protein